MEDVTFNKQKMKELEDNLLYKLSATKGTVSLTSNRAMGPKQGFLRPSFQRLVIVDVRKWLSYQCKHKRGSFHLDV